MGLGIDNRHYASRPLTGGADGLGIIMYEYLREPGTVRYRLLVVLCPVIQRVRDNVFQYEQPESSYALCSIYLYENAQQTMGTT